MKAHTTMASNIILILTALFLSRAMLVLFDDPEGPNLLIVSVLGAFVFAFSRLAYLKNFKMPVNKRALFSFSLQVVIVIMLYFLLR